MKFGFVGAGKVGFSLGKYFTLNGREVVGYFSEHEKDAVEAAEFTNTRKYNTIEELVEDSDALFLTVSDGQIAEVWKKLKRNNIRNKVICHCSGALSSEIFLDIAKFGSYGYSIHPLFAVSNKYDSYKELSSSFFTIEGSPEHMNYFVNMFENFGNRIQIINKADKIKYHAAAAIASNLVLGLINLSEGLLCECGFDENSAHMAISPIMQGNMNHIVSQGTTNALTGPIERNDIATVKKHLACLCGENRQVYIAVSKKVLDIAKKKHPESNYDDMEEILK